MKTYPINLFAKMIKAMLFIFLFLWLILWVYTVYSHLQPNFGQPKLQLVGNKDKCDLQKTPCIADLPSGTKFEIDLYPKPVLSNQQTKANLRIIAGSDIPTSIDFNGQDIEMGYNRPVLKEKSIRIYEGSFVLPTCSAETFEWRAIVIFKNQEDKISGVPFYFFVSRKLKGK